MKNKNKCYQAWKWPLVVLAFFCLVVNEFSFAKMKPAQSQVLPTATNHIVTAAGKGLDVGDNGLATDAQLAQVRNADFDAEGNLFVVDFANNRIRRVDKDTKIITTVVGSAGVAGYYGDNGPATDAQIAGPSGIAFDSEGNYYISEFFGHRVRKVNTAGIIMTVTGNGVACPVSTNPCGDGGPAAAGQLNQPAGLAVDSSNNLYIADELDHRIRKITAGNITTVVGTGTAGYISPGCPTGDGCSATAARISNPGDVTFDSAGNLFIADTNNHRIRKVTAGNITTVAGNGTAGAAGVGLAATGAQLNVPRGVAIDAAGTLYIGEFNNHRVQKVVPGSDGVMDGLADPDPEEIITMVAGNGTPGFSGDDNSPTDAQLSNPFGIALDSAGDLYIADFTNSRVRKVAAGVITTVVGGGFLPLHDGDPATLGQLNSPRDGVVDSLGNLYIADFNNSRIRKVDPNGIITTVAGNGNTGYAVRCSLNPALACTSDSDCGAGSTCTVGDDIPATEAHVNGPWGLGVDAAGNIYFADSNSHRIRKVDTAGIITTVAGTGTVGYISPGCPVGDGCSATAARLNTPRGIDVDAAGNIYIADVGNHRIRKVTAGIITTVAGTGTAGYIHPGCPTGDGCPATVARINRPFDVAVDSFGHIYIADTSNHRIRKVTAGNITTVAGTGATGSAGDNGLATAATINNPAGIVVDSAGNVYIGDTNNNRIRKVVSGSDEVMDGLADPDPEEIITTAVGTELGGFSGDGGLASAAQLNGPRGIDLDSAENLYITDTVNSRIRRLNVATAVTVTPKELDIEDPNGNWVKTTIKLPDGRSSCDVDIDTVMLQAIDPTNGAVRTESGVVLQVARDPDAPVTPSNPSNCTNDLQFRYDRATLLDDDWVDGSSLGLRVEGQFRVPDPDAPGQFFETGRYFSGDTQVQVK